MTASQGDLAAHFCLPFPGEAGGSFATAEQRFAHAVSRAEPLQNAALALRSFLLGIAFNEHRAPGYDPERLCELSTIAMPAIVDAADGQLSAARIVSGMAAFRGLARCPVAGHESPEPADVISDRIDQVALLADELDALSRRHRINVRGAPLARAEAIAAAASAPGASLALH